MTNQSENEETINWFRTEFPLFLADTRKTVKPHIEQWRKTITETRQTLNKFVKEYQAYIDIWVKLAEVYPQLEPHVDNIIVGIDNTEFQVGTDIIELAHIFEAIDLQSDPDTTSILSVISSKNFQKSLIHSYNDSTLNIDRLSLIEEALELHNNEYYAGSICLLYGQFEGVITESFIKVEYIFEDDGKVKAIGTNGKKCTLNGLVAKIDHGIARNDKLNIFYKKVKNHELVKDDKEQTISKTRNGILHGSNVNFNTEERSAQLILWLYSIILQVRVLGV